MKRFLLIASLFACLGLSSCQCSNPPDIGPVEDGEAMAASVTSTITSTITSTMLPRA